MEIFDVAIIGGGPGGYHAASLLGEKGLRVLLVEKDALGGTCLNWGCIPTKTLLNLAKQYTYSSKLSDMGVESTAVYKHSVAMQWKEHVVKTLSTGIGAMLSKYKVVVIEGTATFSDLSGSEKKISVACKDAPAQEYTAKNIIIASGVESVIPPISGIAQAKALTSKEILELEEVPKRLAIIGAGVIGVEMATIFSQLGSKVQLVEALPNILSMMDSDAIRTIHGVLTTQFGVEIYCDTQVVECSKNTMKVQTQGEKQCNIDFDYVLVSTGRKTNLKLFEDYGLYVSHTGIQVNEYMETNLPHVYAIGDIVGSYQLAHVAYRMAEVAVCSILGKKSIMNYNAVPSVVYTNPEFASCGLTEQQAREQGYDIVSAKLSTLLSGRVIAEYGTQSKGFCKIIANKANGVVLGIHLVAPMASEIIAVATVIIETELQVKELVEIIFPHPSVGEIIHNVSMVLASKL